MNIQTRFIVSKVERVFRSLGIALAAIILSACGEVNNNDGTVVNAVELPTDSALTLYCEDAGIAAEPCILDDPENPYAITPVNDDTKFTLNDAAPSAKARYYLWATAQAMSPRGENQFYVAVALHEMFSESGSELARTQALRAYRSVLDNYFNSVTFFKATWVGGNDIFYPYPVRKLVAQNMLSPSAPLAPLFNDPVEALAQFGQWGYTYDDTDSKDFTPNF